MVWKVFAVAAGIHSLLDATRNSTIHMIYPFSDLVA